MIVVRESETWPLFFLTSLSVGWSCYLIWERFISCFHVTFDSRLSTAFAGQIYSSDMRKKWQAAGSQGVVCAY